jgi:hypothetical protein
MKTLKKAQGGTENGKRYLPTFFIFERKLNAIERLHTGIPGPDRIFTALFYGCF